MSSTTTPALRNSRSLEGHVALVTGAGRGVGRELALGLARLGVDLVLVARSDSQLADLASEIGGTVSTTLLTADLSSASDVDRAAAKAVARNVDIVINNAATIAPIGAAGSLAPHEIRAAIQLNLVAPLVIANGVLPYMVAAGWGRIVNLSTGAVSNPTGMIGGGVYVAAKAGVEIHTLSLAAELALSGVTANVYRPGMVDTGMQDFVRQQDADPIARSLSERFVGVQQAGMLVSPATAAASLLNRLGGDENGSIWNVTDSIQA